jgi:hypothetical protein
LIIKITTLTALVLLAFLGAAEAQSVRGFAPSASTPGSESLPSVQVTTGWNFFHISNCLANNGILVFYPLEAIGASYFWANDPDIVATITPACQTGNQVGVFVTDTSAHTWSYFYTFTFK